MVINISFLPIIKRQRKLNYKLIFFIGNVIK